MPRRERPLPDWVHHPPAPPRTVTLTAWVDPAAVRTPRHLAMVLALPVHRRVWLAPGVRWGDDQVLPEPVRTVAELLSGPLSTLAADECGVVLLTGVGRKDAKEFRARFGPGKVRLVRCSRRAGIFELDAREVVQHCTSYDPWRAALPQPLPPEEPFVPELREAG